MARLVCFFPLKIFVRVQRPGRREAPAVKIPESGPLPARCHAPGPAERSPRSRRRGGGPGPAASRGARSLPRPRRVWPYLGPELGERSGVGRGVWGSVLAVAAGKKKPTVRSPQVPAAGSAERAAGRVARRACASIPRCCVFQVDK